MVHLLLSELPKIENTFLSSLTYLFILLRLNLYGFISIPTELSEA